MELTITKVSKNKLNPDITNKHLGEALASLPKFYNPSFSVDEPLLTGEGYVYTAKINLVRINDPPNISIKNSQDELAKSNLENSLKKVNWILRSSPVERTKFELPKLNLNLFKGVYQRDPHIRIIYDSISTYVKTNREKRNHTLLFGDPASCKTTIFERFKLLCDDAFERVFVLDGPSMTKAGLENWLIDRSQSGVLPEIILIEEIEKQPLNNLTCLLSVMQSGYISKTNSKIGAVKEEIKSLIWATCNELDVLQKFRNGALFSRFNHKMFCKRPDKKLIRLILCQEVSKENGNPNWVDKIMELCYDRIPKEVGLQPTNDMREVLAHLDGKDRLLDDTYQKDIIDILRSQHVNQ